MSVLQRHRQKHPAQSVPPLSWREFLLHALLCVLPLILLFPGVFLRGESAFPGGLYLEEDPWRHYAPPNAATTPNNQIFDYCSGYDPLYVTMERALDQGEWPLWIPYINCGAPLMANYQTGVFYPLRWFNVLFDHYEAATLIFLIRLWLCGITAFVCGRVIGLGTGASRFLSFGWMLASYNTLWLYWTLPDVSAWVPILFMGTELTLQGKLRRGFFALLLGAVLVLFGGHPESALGFGLGLGAYFVLRLLLARRERTPVLSRLGVFTAAWIIALVTVSVQVIPFVEYVLHSSNFQERLQGAVSERLVPPLPQEASVAFWVPRFFGATTDQNIWYLTRESAFHPGQQNPLNSNFTSVIYPGIGVWFALAPLLLWRTTSSLNRKRILCMAPPCILGALFAFDHPITAFAEHLPLFTTMHRLYYICFLLFALPLLGALGLQEWFSRPRTFKGLVPAFVLGAGMVLHVAVLLLVHWVTIASEGLLPYVATQIGLAALFGGLTLGLLALHCRWRKPRLLAFGLALVLMVDLTVALRDVHPTIPKDQIHVKTKLLPYMATLPGPARFSLLSANFLYGPQIYYGIEQLWGYEALCPGRTQKFLYECNRRNWKTTEPIAAITYYLFREGTVTEENGTYELLERLDGFDVCRNRHALPRARLVGNLEVVKDGDAVIDRVCGPDFDPKTTAVTEHPVQPPLPSAKASDFGKADVGKADVGKAESAERTLSTSRIEVDAREECVLVVAESYFPGWRAWVDGEPADLFPVYYAFRGVIVPAGRHTVEFRYEPFSFRLGMALTVASLLVGCTAAILVLVSRSTSQRKADARQDRSNP